MWQNYFNQKILKIKKLFINEELNKTVIRKGLFAFNKSTTTLLEKSALGIIQKGMWRLSLSLEVAFDTFVLN